MKIFQKIKKLFRPIWMFEDVTKVQDTEGYYNMAIVCSNCNTGIAVFVKKGHYLKDITPAVKCQNCGCRLKG